MKWLLVAALVACKSDRAGNADDPRKLAALVDRYQTAIQEIAKAVETGTCTDKATALAPVMARHRPVFEELAAAARQPKTFEAIGAIVDARDEAISTPEIAFKQVRFDCQSDPKFAAVIDSMPR